MKYIIAFAIAILACLNLQASDVRNPAESSPWSSSLSTHLMSRYYGTWVGGIFYDGPMSFTTLAASRKNFLGSFYVNASVGRKLDSLTYNKDFGDELDAEIGQSFHIGEGLSRIDVDYHIGYIGSHNLRLLRDDYVSHVLRFDVPNTPIAQPYITIIRSDTVGKVPGAGWFAYGGLVRNLQVGLGDNLFAVRLDYRTGYSFKIYGAGRGWVYHRLEASVPLSLNKIWTITPAVIGQISAHGQPPGQAFIDHSRLLGTLTISRKL
jgi:hypothetical protein